MKSSRIMFACWLGTMALLAIVLSAVPIEEPDEFASPKTDQEPPDNQRKIGLFLAGKAPRPPAARMTCDQHPTVCRNKGSPGPDCCKKQCVNVKTDKQNCGACGKKCTYSEMCCKGKCVNPSTDHYHCGRCNNPCNKGSSCVYGLCSYAD